MVNRSAGLLGIEIPSLQVGALERIPISNINNQYTAAIIKVISFKKGSK